MTDPTDHDELRTLADKLDDIAQRAEEEHISGVRPALRKWDTDRLHAAADVLRDDLQRRQRAYLATKRLTAERDADVSAGAVARTVAMSHIAAERDAERAARERAEAEARQLREAIREHKDRHNSWRQQTQRPSDIALWAALNAAAVAEGAEDRGQTDG